MGIVLCLTRKWMNLVLLIGDAIGVFGVAGKGADGMFLPMKCSVGRKWS